MYSKIFEIGYWSYDLNVPNLSGKPNRQVCGGNKSKCVAITHLGNKDCQIECPGTQMINLLMKDIPCSQTSLLNINILDIKRRLNHDVNFNCQHSFNRGIYPRKTK